MCLRPWPALAAMAFLCVLAYLPAIDLPLIADDYDQINRSRLYGSSGWSGLARDPLYRCRATAYVLTYWTDRAFGLLPLVFNLSSLLLHILNTWLVFALGNWKPIGWRVSAIAAFFFGVYHGHQEAVTWFSALPELLVFFFGLVCFLLWVSCLQRPRWPWHLYAASVGSFLLALYSKESAVALVPLLLLPLGAERQWRRLPLLLPFAVLALAYAAMIFAAGRHHLFLYDGTFSLEAPLLLNLLNSISRLFWVSGLLSLLVLVTLGAKPWKLLLGVAAAWICVTFLPYSFLTYMPFVPSRHTYLASAGLALVVAAGFLTVLRRVNGRRAWIVAALAGTVAFSNCAYLWNRKYPQMKERAAPTEAVVEFARRVEGFMYVHCFPYAADVAVLAVSLRTGRPSSSVVWDPEMRYVTAGAPIFCWQHGLTTSHWQAKDMLLRQSSSFALELTTGVQARHGLRHGPKGIRPVAASHNEGGGSGPRRPQP